MIWSRLVGIGFASIAFSSFAFARVGTIDVGVLARESEVVVVGTVTYVGNVGGVKVAFVDRTEFIKGFAFDRIAFVAEKTWACNTSSAVVGERVLLYLEEIPDSRLAFRELDLVGAKKACARTGTSLFSLGHSGRGRIPLFQRGKDWYAKVGLSGDYPPELNVNLTIPRGAPVVMESEGVGVISVDYFRTMLGGDVRGRMSRGTRNVKELGSFRGVSH
jgi:hypothetical protein